ncbi:hypothetical protein KCU88_g1725, partial [Aureobasidium melanogenum]
MADETKIRVIIAGAGIAGLATAIALGRFNHEFKGILHLDIQLYERATELKEIGASIALSPNGLRTLERLGVTNALSDDIGFRGPAGLPMIYRHWKTNEIVSVDRFSENVTSKHHQTTRFHRAHLHEALLQHVPRNNIHLGKAVESVQVRENDGSGSTTTRAEPVTVFFQDGTSIQGDILIGADGLRSKVRATFRPDHKLHWTGRTFFRSTFDASLVDNEKIPDLPPDSTHWWGPQHTFFASRLGKNMFTTVGNFDPTQVSGAASASGSGSESKVNWDQEGDVTAFRDLYKDWNPVVKALANATPYVRLYPNFAGEPLDTWVFGDSRVTLVGDAAHTHGGAHAAGGSLALDDAWALYLAFRHVVLDHPHRQTRRLTVKDIDIHRALSLYEKTRRPHTERLVKSVLAGSKAAVTPDSDEALRLKMTNRPRTTWLTEHDVNAEFANVVQTAAQEGQKHLAPGQLEVTANSSPQQSTQQVQFQEQSRL